MDRRQVPIDHHWVIRGDTAQQALIDQGYKRTATEMRHGKRWDLMARLTLPDNPA